MGLASDADSLRTQLAVAKDAYATALRQAASAAPSQTNHHRVADAEASINRVSTRVVHLFARARARASEANAATPTSELASQLASKLSTAEDRRRSSAGRATVGSMLARQLARERDTATAMYVFQLAGAALIAYMAYSVKAKATR